MGTLRLNTGRTTRNAVRVPSQWNASIRAGDDFKLALTVYADDAGTPAQVVGSRARMTLWPDTGRDNVASDYGLGWYTGGSGIGRPGLTSQQIDGFPTSVRAGGINFYLSGTATLALCGRYRFSLEVDLADGDFSQVEGVLQVRTRWQAGLGHVPQLPFQLDVSQLDLAFLAPLLDDAGLPVDIDGFPLSGLVSGAFFSLEDGSGYLLEEDAGFLLQES